MNRVSWRQNLKSTTREVGALLYGLSLLVLVSCTRVLVLGDDLGLRDTADAGLGAVRTVTSVVPQVVTFVESTPLDVDARLMAFVGDGRLTVAVDSAPSFVASTRVEGPTALALTSEPTAVVWVATARGIETFQATAPGVLTAGQTFSLPFWSNRLRRLSTSTVVTWGADQLAILRLGSPPRLAGPFDGELFDVLQVNAGLSMPDGGRNGDEVLVALTARGALAALASSPSAWQPVALEKSSSLIVQRLDIFEASGRALGLEQSSGLLLQGTFAPPPDRRFTWLMTAAGDALQLTSKGAQPCAQVEALTVGPSASDWRLFCRAADGGLAVATTALTHEPLERELTAVSRDGLMVAGSGRAFRAIDPLDWLPVTPPFERVVSLFGRATRPILTTEAFDAGLPIGPAVCASRGTPWLWCSPGQDVGVRVHAKADWAIASGLTVYDLDSGKKTMRLGSAVADVTAAIAIDGSLFVAQNRDIAQGPEFSPLVSLPVGPITALTGRSPRDLFAVAGGLVFAVTSNDEGRWSWERLETDQAVTVWNEGSRARVLRRDGSVRVLPTGVEVVGPTSEQFVAAEAYCGQTFAVSTTGLFRLVVSGDKGRWERVVLADVPPSAFGQAKLLAEENSLFVQLPGAAPRLVSNFGCAP